MNLTIDMYMEQIYTVRSELDEEIKHNIELVHSEVFGTYNSEIPLCHINSYDVNSCILPLEEIGGKNYYHIVDHSTFEYCNMILSAFEFKQPNLATAIYAALRHDICIAKGNKVKAEEYKKIPIVFTEYDMHVEEERMMNPQILADHYLFMLRFYFEHEYNHYLFAKYANFDYGFYDSLVEILSDKMLRDSESMNMQSKEIGNLYKPMLNEYKRQYRTNKEFREEII